MLGESRRARKKHAAVRWRLACQGREAERMMRATAVAARRKDDFKSSPTEVQVYMYAHVCMYCVCGCVAAGADRGGGGWSDAQNPSIGAWQRQMGFGEADDAYG